MTAALRRGELVKLGRVLREDLAFTGALDLAALRTLREAISARLFDDAKPMLQRVATGAKLLPNGLVARVGENVFGSLLCAQVASLLSTAQALDVALRMPDAFLAQISADLDPRRAGAVIAQIPADRVVAVAHVMIERGDYVTLARFVDFVSRETIGAVIDSVADELQLLRIAAYVESPTKLAELVGQLAPERTRAMIAALHGANAELWLEALAVAELLDDGWRRTLADIVASLDATALLGLIDTAQRLDVWSSALPLVLAMSADSLRVFAAQIAAQPDAVLGRLAIAASATPAAWPALAGLVGILDPATRDRFTAAAAPYPEMTAATLG